MNLLLHIFVILFLPAASTRNATRLNNLDKYIGSANDRSWEGQRKAYSFLARYHSRIQDLLTANYHSNKWTRRKMSRRRRIRPRLLKGKEPGKPDRHQDQLGEEPYNLLVEQAEEPSVEQLKDQGQDEELFEELLEEQLKDQERDEEQPEQLQ
ncbi:hypothetical protein B9Z55_025995 [Caenorhabditis nigoni]|uniref:Uncharacterized protein n=1 Tax=Caenorhabditis nigoni TaxID=1611254 RepID=A0A2G5T1L1_9PELO|nr:hypothetical protein B9Z55_025995 [Caenorhabditis nigoni]